MQDFSIPAVGSDFQRLDQQVYAALLSAITDRRIKPGQRLVLDDLAEQLQVSRTPIRVALSRLAAEGLVQPFGKMGYSVTRLSVDELRELYDVRLMCECFAVETGMSRVTPELLTELESVLIDPADYLKALNPEERLKHVLKDREFHRRIVALPQNRTLSDLYERLNIHVHAISVGPLPISPEERVDTNNNEHSAILDALRAGSVEGARAALTTHVRNSVARTIAALKMGQGPAGGESTQEEISH